MIDSTEAKIGRSMKKRENMGETSLLLDEFGGAVRGGALFGLGGMDRRGPGQDAPPQPAAEVPHVAGGEAQGQHGEDDSAEAADGRRGEQARLTQPIDYEEEDRGQED